MYTAVDKPISILAPLLLDRKLPIARTPCRFKLSNRCNRGDRCNFAHLPSIAAPTPKSRHKPCENGVPTQILWQTSNMSLHTGICNAEQDTTSKATTKAKGNIMSVVVVSDDGYGHHKTIVKPKAKSKTTKLQLDGVPGVWTIAHNRLAQIPHPFQRRLDNGTHQPRATHCSKNQWPKILFATPC